MSPETARALLERAIEGHPALTVDALVSEASRPDGLAKIFCGARSVVFARVSDGVCEGGPAGGDREEIVAMVPLIERWAKDLGAHDVLIQSGRDGWERAFAPLGYERAAIILHKALV